MQKSSAATAASAAAREKYIAGYIDDRCRLCRSSNTAAATDVAVAGAAAVAAQHAVTIATLATAGQ